MSNRPVVSARARLGWLTVVVAAGVVTLLVAVPEHAAGGTGAACPPGDAPPSGFDDATSGAHASSIDCVAWWEIAQGRTAETFAPTADVRRDQMATFVARTVGLATDLPPPSAQGFADIAGNLHADAINRLAALGVVGGIADDRYGPDRPVRRDQMATFLVGAWEAVTGDRPVARRGPHFDDTGGNVHAAAIDAAYERGWAQGTAVRTYAPGETIRRGQMASFLARFLDDLVAAGHVEQRVVFKTDLRVLLISPTGSETSSAWARQLFRVAGVPYEELRLDRGSLTSRLLSNGSDHGRFNAIVVVEPSAGGGSLSADERERLRDYQRNFDVRKLVLNARPDGDADGTGLRRVSTVDASRHPVEVRRTAAGRAVFPYVVSDSALRIETGTASLAATIGRGNIPVLTARDGDVLAALLERDGREALLLTFDLDADVWGARIKQFGLLQWVTRGLHVGRWEVMFLPQIDDVFISSVIWDPDAQAVGDDVYRMTGEDLHTIADWVAQRRRNPLTAGLWVDMVFNGAGAWDREDALVVATLEREAEFLWTNHTLNHWNMDDLTYEESWQQIHGNIEVADDLDLTHFDRTALVTGEISGLDNPAALRAAVDAGVRYMIADTSVMTAADVARGGKQSHLEPSIFLIPRRPTGIAYFTSTPEQQVGWYNHALGTSLTYEEMVSRIAVQHVGHWLTGENLPFMYHQANLHAYTRGRSIFTDVVDAAVQTYAGLVSLPVRTHPQSVIGARLQERQRAEAAGTTVRLVGGTHLALESNREVEIDLTGPQLDGSEAYADASVSRIAVPRGVSTIRLPD